MTGSTCSRSSSAYPQTPTGCESIRPASRPCERCTRHQADRTDENCGLLDRSEALANAPGRQGPGPVPRPLRMSMPAATVRELRDAIAAGPPAVEICGRPAHRGPRRSAARSTRSPASRRATGCPPTAIARMADHPWPAFRRAQNLCTRGTPVLADPGIVHAALRATAVSAPRSRGRRLHQENQLRRIRDRLVSEAGLCPTRNPGVDRQAVRRSSAVAVAARMALADTGGVLSPAAALAASSASRPTVACLRAPGLASSLDQIGR